MKFEQMQRALETAGVVGAGGAGFPTHRKMTQGIHTVLINGVECEPLLRTDACLLHHFLAEVVAGAEAFAGAMQAPDVVLCVKRHNAGVLGLAEGQALGAHTRVVPVPDVYPMGDEIVLIYEALGLRVEPGALPSSVGVVVVNAETALNIHGAVQGRPVTEKWLTLGGAVPKPCVLRVPVGMPVGTVLAAKDVAIPEEHVLVDGGPAMGTLVDPATACVTKTTKALLVLPEKSAAVQAKRADPGRLAKRTASACCQCSLCTDLCPRQLLGWPLQPHKTLRSAGMRRVGNPDDVVSATLCSGCGVCTFAACCQGCTPSVVMGAAKQGLLENGLRYSGAAGRADPARAYRMVPSSRFAALLGVHRFEKPAQWDAHFEPELAFVKG